VTRLRLRDLEAAPGAVPAARGICVYIYITDTYIKARDEIRHTPVGGRNTSPHQDSAGTAPSGTAAPNTTDTGDTVPQRDNPIETAYAHYRKRAKTQRGRCSVHPPRTPGLEKR